MEHVVIFCDVCGSMLRAVDRERHSRWHDSLISVVVDGPPSGPVDRLASGTWACAFCSTPFPSAEALDSHLASDRSRCTPVPVPEPSYAAGTVAGLGPKVTGEPEVVHGTDDEYPYGGDYEAGRDYTITCYCGREFTEELDGYVKASFEHHLDDVAQERQPEAVAALPDDPGMPELRCKDRKSGLHNAHEWRAFEDDDINGSGIVWCPGTRAVMQ